MKTFLPSGKWIWLVRIGIVLVSIVLGLGLLEISLRKFIPRQLDRPLAEQLERTKKERDNLNEASRIIKIFDPILEHAMYPHRAVLDSMDGQVCRMTTNGQGFRGPGEFQERKDPGVYRVAIQGDSFTFGEYVNDSDPYPAQLQVLFDRSGPNASGLMWQVYNFGCVSYSPLLYFQQYKTQVRKYHPDLLIIAIDNSDLQDDFYYELEAVLDEKGECQRFRESHFVFFLGRPRDIGYPSQRVEALEKQLASSWGRLTGWLKSNFQLSLYLSQAKSPDRLKFGDIATDRMGHFREGVDWTPHWKRSATYLRETIRMAKSDGVDVLLLYYPYPHQINGTETPGRVFQGFSMGRVYETPLRGWLHDFAREEKVSLLDTVETFRRSNLQKICFQKDPHYTAVGYRILAEALYKHLTQNPRCAVKGKPQVN